MTSVQRWKIESRTWTPNLDGAKHEWVQAREREGWTVLELHRTVDAKTREDAVVFELRRPLQGDPLVLSDIQRIVLTAVVRLTDQTGRAATSDVRDRAAQMLGVEGVTFNLAGAGPWWGLDDIVCELVKLELLSYNPGVGIPIAPDSAARASIEMSYNLVPTRDGRAWVTATYPDSESST